MRKISPHTHGIAVIAFRRPHITLNTLHALGINYDIDNTPLHIFVDGARSDNEQERAQVAEVVSLSRAFKWNGKKKVHVSKINRGLQLGVRYAIDTVLSDYPAAIIVEDDIYTSPYFYRFMSQGLQRFIDHENIAAICGYCYSFNRKKFNPTSPYLLRHFSCWGWATWRRAWETVQWDTQLLKDTLKASRRTDELNFGIGEFVSGILEAHHNGYVDTWDVQTGVSFFLNNQMCLYPPETLTNNTGWRNNTGSTHVVASINPNPPIAIADMTIPDDFIIKESQEMRQVYTQWCYSFATTIKFALKRTLFPLYRILRTTKRAILSRQKNNQKQSQ